MTTATYRLTDLPARSVVELFSRLSDAMHRADELAAEICRNVLVSGPAGEEYLARSDDDGTT